MINKKSITDLTKKELEGKRVLVRVDFNVPLNKKLSITDDTRIKAAIPTIEYLSNNGAKVILTSHLGRPDGKIDEELRLTPVAQQLSKLMNKKIIKIDSSIGKEADETVLNLNNSDILLLENIRFHKGDTDNDPELAKSLSELADIFVNDAFGVAHRSHASTTGITKFIPAVSGFLLNKEISMLSKILENPKKPFIAIVGGAKISSKLATLKNLIEKVDTLIIGGGMSFTLLKAQGYEVGKSLVEENLIEEAKAILKLAKENNTKIMLPIDQMVIPEFSEKAPKQIVDIHEIPKTHMGVDNGPKTTALILEEIKKAKTVLWNGPLGVFEMDSFATGTFEVAKALAESSAETIIGGGDSAAAIAKCNLSHKMTHISTGGGASIEFLEGKDLPGVSSLSNK